MGASGSYLIEDLLELSRARAGELRVEAKTFPLEPCVNEVAERMRTVTEQRGVGIRRTIPVAAVALLSCRGHRFGDVQARAAPQPVAWA